MKIGFIGAGKVGKTLGQYFVKNHINVIGYYSRTVESAIEGARLTGSKFFLEMEEIIKEAEGIFITTNDDAIREVVDEMADSKNIRRDHILVHTSGLHSTSAFGKLEHLGCGFYSIHPLQSFSDSVKGIKDMEKTHFTVEGSGVHLHKVTELFEKIGNPYYIIDQKQKGVYHAGACILSNYFVTLMSIGFDFIESSGFPKEKIYSAFVPLIEGTLENLKDKGVRQSLTGPISRGDKETIEKHLDAIEKNIHGELEFYKYMGMKTLEMIEKDSFLDDNKKAIKNILMEGFK